MYTLSQENLAYLINGECRDVEYSGLVWVCCERARGVYDGTKIDGDADGDGDTKIRGRGRVGLPSSSPAVDELRVRGGLARARWFQDSVCTELDAVH